MLARIRLMPRHAMQAPVCQLPAYRGHTRRFVCLPFEIALDPAHRYVSERMFEPQLGAVGRAAP
jgi:hypothetical protein